MRVYCASLLVAVLLCCSEAALASEKGLIIRAGELRAQPFIDAPVIVEVTANQSITIVERRGGWLSVEANGQPGWVRALNVRLEPRGRASPNQADSGGKPRGAITGNAQAVVRGRGASDISPTSLLRTGSSGKTVTTGVKGMDEEDIRNAAINYEELGKLNELGTDPADASADAKEKMLKESTVASLKKGKAK